MIFGKSYNDIKIYDECDKNSSSYCNIGQTYSLPEDKSIEAKNYMAGIENFKVLEIEVYQVSY